MNARHSIEAQARARMPQLWRQAAVDVAHWNWNVGGPVGWARSIVRLGLLGSIAKETGPTERVKVATAARTATDCEDRCLRLGFAVKRKFPAARVSLDWVGNPPWHVRLLVDGQVVETMPEAVL